MRRASRLPDIVNGPPRSKKEAGLAVEPRFTRKSYRQRRHSTLAYLTPAEYEALATERAIA